ncbi:MAG TPA: DMT family transporter [Methylomirabilota bacterium]|nr:DMT family transporter [Methylomirabilota bacterium]
MPTAYLVFLLANAVYGTSYVATRIVLEHGVGPATLAVTRLVIGAAMLAPLALARRPADNRLSGRDRWRVGWMGVLGFAAAFAFANWGIAGSTATNAALLITVEPVSLILLSPLFLGERLTCRELVGATLTLAGATLVVLNGVPGLSVSIAPHWRGDLLLVLSGLAYAAYSLIGRSVLARHAALPVTTWSMLWGLAAMVPLGALEWLGGHRPRWSAAALIGTAYLGVVITALGYLVWNWVLERVEAPRLALFVNVQPVVGACLGIWWLGEPLTAFTVIGGALVLVGLHVALRSGRMV